MSSIRKSPRNVDPRLRRTTAARERALGQEAARPEPVFIEVANAGAAKWLVEQEWVTNKVNLIEGYFTAKVPPDLVDDLAAADGIVEVEAVRGFQPHLIQSLKRIHGGEPSAREPGAPDGKGVVIGFVDYGLDFSQTDFQNPADGSIQDANNPKGVTRVAYLWDQTLMAENGEHPPKKYDYGVEYTWEDIDRASSRSAGRLLRHDPRGAADIPGHGTHVAGIAAGNGTTADDRGGFGPGKYVGVAPAATLVFVNLDRKEIFDTVGSVSGTLANSVNIAHGVAYCFEQADKLKMPCVVNLSLGCNGGGHDGNMALEWIIDALLEKSGRAVVIAAGNDDGAGTHAAGSLKKGGRTELKWLVGVDGNPDPNPNEMEIWYPSGSAVSVQLVAPDGEPSKQFAPDEGDTHDLAGGEKATIHSDADTPWNGAARIYVRLEGTPGRDIRSGTWIVKLHATKVGPDEAGGRVHFDAWIERTLPAGGGGLSSFAKPKRQTTLATPCTSRRAIVVASFKNTGAGTISKFSGSGPTRDGRPKPEVAAPGEPVFSTQAGAGLLDDKGKKRKARIDMTGTSQAAPHVAGVIARMLELNAFLSSDEIREILVESADPPRGIKKGKWDCKWGYGKVNAARAVEVLRERLLRTKRPAPAAANRRRG